MNYRPLFNSNFHLIRSKPLATNDFESTVPDLYPYLVWSSTKSTVCAYPWYVPAHEKPDLLTVPSTFINLLILFTSYQPMSCMSQMNPSYFYHPRMQIGNNFSPVCLSAGLCICSDLTFEPLKVGPRSLIFSTNINLYNI